MPQPKFNLYDYNRIKHSVINTNTNKPYTYKTYRSVITGERKNEIISKAVEHYFNVLLPKAQDDLKLFVIQFINKKQK